LNGFNSLLGLGAGAFNQAFKNFQCQQWSRERSFNKLLRLSGSLSICSVDFNQMWGGMVPWRGVCIGCLSD